MITNRVSEAYREGRLCFGNYVTTASPRMVELLGAAGLDFVRIDMADVGVNIETVESMIRTAHAVGITPFVRVPEDSAWHIQIALQMGALGVIVPRVTGPEDVEAAVRAAKPPPVGERHAGPGGFTGRYGAVSSQEYLDWVHENVLLSVQVETKAGVEAIDEIVAVPGLDMVQSGRGDLSYAYSVPGQQYHPMVLEAERVVMEAALEAGKMASVQYYPLRDHDHVTRLRDWIDRGVHCLSVGSDKDIVEVFRRLLAELKT